jgi:hypothetical protein
LQLPGLEAAWMCWLVAVALVAVDPLLVGTWHRRQHRGIAGLGLGGVLAVSMAIECLAWESYLERGKAQRAVGQQRVELAAQRLTHAEGAVEALALEVRELLATQHIWDADGDPSNDGYLAAAEYALSAARADLAQREAEMDGVVGHVRVGGAEVRVELGAVLGVLLVVRLIMVVVATCSMPPGGPPARTAGLRERMQSIPATRRSSVLRTLAREVA